MPTGYGERRGSVESTRLSTPNCTASDREEHEGREHRDQDDETVHLGSVLLAMVA